MADFNLQTNFRRLSLNQKAVLVLVTASLMLSFIASTVFFALEYRSSLSKFQDDLFAQAVNLAEAMAPSLVFLDGNEANEFADDVMTDQRIHGLRVVDMNGEVFVERAIRGILSEQLEFVAEPVSESGRVRVGVPLEYQGQQVGQLVLLYDSSEQRITGAQYIRLLATFLVSGLIVTALLLLFLRKYATRPIVDLAEFARRISVLKQYNERIPDDGRTDEIGTLSSAFNDMLDTISEGQQRLENYAGELESLVALRTEQLNRRANFDQLTGLPNRYQLMDRMEEMLEDAGHLDRRLALLLVDLDRFKNINDSLGHHAGDVLLREISQRITDCLRPDEFLARLGGDEFVVIMPEIQGEADAIELASRLMDVIQSAIYIEHVELHTSASIGISIFPDHGANASELLKCADISMYSSKDTGRGTFSVYSAMMATHTRRLQIEAALAVALEKEEFELLYQPQIELFSGRIAGFEALLRWNNAELDNPPPDEFIPIAAEMSFIHDITAWVIATASRDLSSIRSLGLSHITVAVNVTPSTLFVDGFQHWLVDAMEVNKLTPGSLEIEITEDIFMSKSDDVFDILKGLQNSGVRVAIDDFGTRYSSLLHLVGFPLDTLKVDSQFVAGIETSNKHRSLVSAIIALAHGLGLRVIAEGVELDSQKEFLASLNCDLMQGYLVRGPVSCDEIMKTFSPEGLTTTVTKLPVNGRS